MGYVSESAESGQQRDEKSSLLPAGVAVLALVTLFLMASSEAPLVEGEHAVFAAAESAESSAEATCLAARNAAAARGFGDVPEVKKYPLGQQFADTCTAAVLQGATLNPHDPNSYTCVGKSARVLIDPEQGEITAETQPALYVESGKCSTISCTKPPVGGAFECFPAQSLTNLGGLVQSSGGNSSLSADVLSRGEPANIESLQGEAGSGIGQSFNEPSLSDTGNVSGFENNNGGQLDALASGPDSSAGPVITQQGNMGSTFAGNSNLRNSVTEGASANTGGLAKVDVSNLQINNPQTSTFGATGPVSEGFLDATKNAEGSALGTLLQKPFSFISGLVNGSPMQGTPGPYQNNFSQVIGIRG